MYVSNSVPALSILSSFILHIDRYMFVCMYDHIKYCAIRCMQVLADMMSDVAKQGWGFVDGLENLFILTHTHKRICIQISRHFPSTTTSVHTYSTVVSPIQICASDGRFCGRCGAIARVFRV